MTGDDIRAGIGAMSAIVSELDALAGAADVAAMQAAWTAEEKRA